MTDQDWPEEPLVEALADQAPPSDLESLAMGVELTLASVLQGIALAILVPRIVDLLTAGVPAKLPYIPASLLLLFMVWVAFICHAISFFAWPFDLLHNLLYFLIVTSEAVLLLFIDQPAQWFLGLFSFGVVMGCSYWYNQRLLRRQESRYRGVAGQALFQHILADQRSSVNFMAGYCLVGLLGFIGLQLRPEMGLPQDLGWVVTGCLAMVLPLVHVRWQARMLVRRMRLIERARSSQAG